MENATTLQQLFNEVKKLRDLQKKFWNSKAQNELQQDYKKKLLIKCKEQEHKVDMKIMEIEDIQQQLAL